MPAKNSLNYIGMASATGLLLVSLFGGPVAGAQEQPNSTADGHKTLKQVADDKLIETMAALEASGAIGSNNQFDDLYLGSELVDSGTLIVRYNAKSPNAAEFAKSVAEASKSAPLKLKLTGVNVDPGALRRMASEISAGGDTWLHILGVKDIQAVEVNQTTGELTVRTSGAGSAATITVHGVKITIVGGASVHYQVGS